jgi:predicted amino acid-binding ACT domain protein
MNDLKNQNKQLIAQLADVQAQLAAQHLQHDTVVQKRQKTDTLIIYKYLPTPKTGAKKSTSTSFSQKNTPQTLSRTPSVSNDFLTAKTPILNTADALSSPINILQQDTTAPKVSNEERKMAELTEKLAALDKQITDLKQAITEQKMSAAHLADCATKQDSLKKQLGAAMALADSLQKHPLSIDAKKTDKSLKNNRLFVGIQGGKINYKTTWKAA